MLLAKRCNKPHNIKNGTLKIGTLHEYRKTEIKQIADKEEGVLKFNIKFDKPVQIDRKIFNTLCGGQMNFGIGDRIEFPGDIEAQFIQLNVDHNGEVVTLTDSIATITRWDVNSFIFCMSRIEDPNESEEMFPDYDDQWYIAFEDAHDFAIEMGKTLLSSIHQEYANGNLHLPPNIKIGDLQLRVRHGDVNYTPREILITNDTTFLLDDLIRQMVDIAYTKPPIPFQTEKEYRFQYTVVANGEIFAPHNNPMFINSSTLQRFSI